MERTVLEADGLRHIRSNVSVESSIFAEWIPVKEAAHPEIEGEVLSAVAVEVED